MGRPGDAGNQRGAPLMPAAWAFPWHLLDAPAERTYGRLTELGIDQLNVAAHYHSVQTLDPLSEDGLFRGYPGGCTFDPDPAGFADTPIRPSVNRLSGHADPLKHVVAQAREYGIGVNAWVVCHHNSALGASHPAYRIQSAFGDGHDHALCPSHRAVREYFGAVVGNLASYDISGIGLESIGFPSVLHSHGRHFGHQKNYAITSAPAEILLSQCFCDGCREAATDHPVDLDRAEAVVREHCRRALKTPDQVLAPLSVLVSDSEVLADLFDFRASVIDDLLAELASRSGTCPLTYYMSDGFGRDPGGGWPSGVRLEHVSTHLDRVTALCYTDDPEVARTRVEALQSAVDIPVDAGVTLDPEIVPDQERFRAVLSAIERTLEGDIHLYAVGLLTEEHLEWARTVRTRANQRGTR